MWMVFRSVSVVDPRFGRRTVEFKLAEGSFEFCKSYLDELADSDCYVVFCS